MLQKLDTKQLLLEKTLVKLSKRFRYFAKFFILKSSNFDENEASPNEDPWHQDLKK